MRSYTVLWGGVVNQENVVTDELFHAVDWLPTLVSIAGGNVGKRRILLLANVNADLF